MFLQQAQAAVQGHFKYELKLFIAVADNDATLLPVEHGGSFGCCLSRCCCNLSFVVMLSCTKEDLSLFVGTFTNCVTLAQSWLVRLLIAGQVVAGQVAM